VIIRSSSQPSSTQCRRRIDNLVSVPAIIWWPSHSPRLRGDRGPALSVVLATAARRSPRSSSRRSRRRSPRALSATARSTESSCDLVPFLPHEHAEGPPRTVASRRRRRPFSSSPPTPPARHRGRRAADPLCRNIVAGCLEQARAERPRTFVRLSAQRATWPASTTRAFFSIATPASKYMINRAARTFPV